VILQVSENTVAFHGALRPLSAALVALAGDAEVPVSLHLDHVEAPDSGVGAAAGYSSMVDGGACPRPQRRRDGRGHRASARAGLAVERSSVRRRQGHPGDNAHTPVCAQTHGRPPNSPTRQGLTPSCRGRQLTRHDHPHRRTRRRSSALSAVPVPLVLHGSPVPDEALRRAGIVKVNIGTALNIAIPARCARP
jgi:fructose-bisphosphate aldolase class II